MNIGYIGSSIAMINALKCWKNHNVCIWFCDSTKKSYELDSVSETLGIPLFYIDKEEQIIEQLVNLKSKLDYFVVYKTGIIIHRSLLEEYAFFNFHPGSLFTNRGAYPLVWTVLLGEEKATMSLHKISEDIDAGPLIWEKDILVHEGDTPQYLEERLEQEIADMLDKIDLYREGKCEAKIIENGIYRRRVEKKDYTIDFEQDSLEVMRRKINSQRGYCGAVLVYNERELRCFSVEIMEKLPENSSAEKDSVFLEKNGHWYCFSIAMP